MKNKYYNPTALHLSGREYIVLAELENGAKKIKIPTFFGEKIIAYPKDLDGSYKESCEKLWQKEKYRVAKANGWIDS